MSNKILLIDDDVQMVRVVEALLRNSGYATIEAFTAEDGLRLASLEQPDLVLLDVMLPNMGGWEVCRQMREFSDVPIIFLTALHEVENLVRGLEMGADDYLVKPFKKAELLARIRAHLRRGEDRRPGPRLVFGDGELIIDIPARQVFVAGEERELTPREFDLLTTLAQNAGRVLTTRELVQQAWGLNYRAAGYNIKPYIHYVRKKIEANPSDPRWIQTARGVGYRFVDDG